MWESAYVSLTEAAEIVSERANCNGRRVIEAAWEEGVITVEQRYWQGNLFWSRTPGGKPNGSYIWREAPPAPVDWNYNPYASSGPHPDRDLRFRRADMDKLWPPQSSVEETAQGKTRRDLTEQEWSQAECDETKAERCVGEAVPPPRRGSYEVADKPLVAEGVHGFLSGRWKSANEAAKELQSKAVGNSPESRRDRLQRQISAGIKKATGADPNVPETARNIPNQPK